MDENQSGVYGKSLGRKLFVAFLSMLGLVLLTSWIEQVTYPKHENNDLVTNKQIINATRNEKVALLFKATVEPVRLELDRLPYFVVNDVGPTAWLDNTSSRQECLVTMTAAATRNMSGLITRKGGYGQPDESTERAYKELNINLHNFGWWSGEQFAEPEAKIYRALHLIDEYHTKMHGEKEVVVNFNPDVLQELITQIIDRNSGNGILDMGYSRITGQSPNDSWFNSDERFYCAQGGARLVHSMLYAIKHLFPEEVNFRNKGQHLDTAIDAFYTASNLNPVIILDVTKDVFYMQYWYSVGILALERFSSKQTKNN